MVIGTLLMFLEPGNYGSLVPNMQRSKGCFWLVARSPERERFCLKVRVYFAESLVCASKKSVFEVSHSSYSRNRMAGNSFESRRAF